MLILDKAPPLLFLRGLVFSKGMVGSVLAVVVVVVCGGEVPGGAKSECKAIVRSPGGDAGGDSGCSLVSLVVVVGAANNEWSPAEGAAGLGGANKDPSAGAGLGGSGGPKRFERAFEVVALVVVGGVGLVERNMVRRVVGLFWMANNVAKGSRSEIPESP